MKRTFYLFNPGIMDRKDNTLKFTPVAVTDDGHELCLDISEIFKPIIVDRVIFKELNKHALSASHFDKKLNKCVLNENGKKIFVKAMEDRYNETFHHRSLKRNVSYKHLIKLECYKLLKDLLGIEEYQPFKMYW